MHDAAESMKEAFLLHACLILVLLLMESASVLSAISASYIILFNNMCLCERIWAIQFQTLPHWPILAQGTFVASRLITVTALVLIISLIIKINFL